jgi:hypothetical protein
LVTGEVLLLLLLRSVLPVLLLLLPVLLVVLAVLVDAEVVGGGNVPEPARATYSV